MVAPLVAMAALSAAGKLGGFLVGRKAKRAQRKHAKKALKAQIAQADSDIEAFNEDTPRRRFQLLDSLAARGLEGGIAGDLGSTEGGHRDIGMQQLTAYNRSAKRMAEALERRRSLAHSALKAFKKGRRVEKYGDIFGAMDFMGNTGAGIASLYHKPS